MKSVNAALGLNGNGRNKSLKPKPRVNAKPARNVNPPKPSVNRAPPTQRAQFR